MEVINLAVSMSLTLDKLKQAMGPSLNFDK